MLAKLIADYAVAKKELVAKMEVALKQELREVFVKCPELKNIVWAQYAPYFNDGDECVFAVHEPTFTNDEFDHSIAYGETPNQGDDGIWAWGYNCYNSQEGAVPEEYHSVFEELRKSLASSEMEPILREMFGNHVIVQVTADGVTVEGYSHD